MKNPKMMMGLVALLLAGAGAFASISNVQQTRYYLDDVSDPDSCTPVQITDNCEPGQPTCLEEVAPGKTRLLYDDDDCSIELEKASGF